MFLIAYFNTIDASNVWLIPPFGASLVLVMAVHDSPLAKPRNVFFGHIFSASSGVDEIKKEFKETQTEAETIIEFMKTQGIEDARSKWEECRCAAGREK